MQIRNICLVQIQHINIPLHKNLEFVNLEFPCILILVLFFMCILKKSNILRSSFVQYNTIKESTEMFSYSHSLIRV